MMTGEAEAGLEEAEKEKTTRPWGWGGLMRPGCESHEAASQPEYEHDQRNHDDYAERDPENHHSHDCRDTGRVIPVGRRTAP
jgi:hypothetical protein